MVKLRLMSQTLPAIEEAAAHFESRTMEATSVPETLRDAGAQTTHFLGHAPRPRTAAHSDSAVLELVIPVYNEENALEASVRRLRNYLDESFPFETHVRIVDNASTDGTWEIARRLADSFCGVSALHLDRKGRGYALRTAWSASTAELVAYMDVDLSTDLGGLLPLVAPLLSGHSDVAIGSRLARGARVVRGPKRELISRAYNLLLRLSLHGRFSDAQCGFKALRRESAQELLPLVKDDEWFFDTELLIAAERIGLRICEVPVDWVDDPDSRVQICRTVISDLRGVWRISHGTSRKLAKQRSDPAPAAIDQVVADPLLRFAGVGAISTLVYLLLFVVLRRAVDTYVANALAMAICALFNLALHKQLARNLSGRKRHLPRLTGMAVGLYVVSLSFTSLALLAAHTLAASSLSLTILAVALANALAAILRFAVLRAWIFRPNVLA
jgi:glycosyltransferase involved in cell wall biosynthesis